MLAPAGKAVRKPRRQHGLEHGVGTRGIHDARSRVETGFDRVAADDLLAEAVDGGGADLIEMFGGRSQIRFLLLVQAFGQRAFEHVGWLARKQGADISANAERQFACGEFGEGDGRDLGGSGAVGKEHRDPAGDQRGFSGTCCGFDEKRRVEVRQHAPALLAIG